MSTTSPHPAERGDDTDVITALKAGDETAFVELARAHHGVLLRVAMTFVGTRATAEEVVQATWLGVLRALDGDQGRRSLRAWIVLMASSTARAHAAGELRCLRFAALAARELERSEPSVDPERFREPEDGRFGGHWRCGPAAWAASEERLRSRETRELIRDAIEQLPPAERLVVTLRDVEGWSAEETCHALELIEGNQRVLLHRARSKLRAALERHLSPAQRTA
jgi:RNA polymerase sigma-70 factor (ECF subfamily)